MKRKLLSAIAVSLISQQVEAARFPSVKARAAFREAVEDYQVFVVPRCAPQEVEAYVAARSERDRVFVNSLRKAGLLDDYKTAVADRAKQDANTAFHCFGPPPPPPPLPGAVSSSAVPLRQSEPENTLAEHFAAGDRQFAVMLRLRDTALDSSAN